MKGIILVGGYGTRLQPLTLAVSKQLLPIYDKPMAYYPLSVLMLANIQEILFITTPKDRNNYELLFGDGSQLGMSFQYLQQESPLGLAHPFIIAKDFIGSDDVCLILGDNIFYGDNFSSMLKNSMNIVSKHKKAVVFGYEVDNPSQFGIATFDAQKNVVDLEEKPVKPKSNYAIIGLYFYPNDVIREVNKINPSSRGELEITDLNKVYLKNKKLSIQILGRGFTWLDTGTPEDYYKAFQFVASLERSKAKKIGCIEEIAYKNNWITELELKSLIKKVKNTSYSSYLKKLLIN